MASQPRIHLGQLRLPATLDNLRIVAFFIQGIGNRLGLSETCLFDVELAVEEATTNIINHAYEHQTDGDVQLSIDQQGDILHIQLTDWGEPLNPKNVKPYDPHAPIETRIKGGMGLHFIHSLMDDVHRAIGESGENQLQLQKIIRRAAPTRNQDIQAFSALQTISAVMTADVDLDDLLNLIVQKLVETIDAERGTLYLVDQDQQECYSHVFTNVEKMVSEIRVKLGHGIAGTVAQTGETLNITDAQHHPLFTDEYDRQTGFHTQTILAVPMRNPQQEVIGVVQLLNKRSGAFTTADARLLTAMASQAAISIEHGRLYEQALQQQALAQELETARMIQQSFLPEYVPDIEGWDVAAFWQPMEGVAGDFYDFHRLDNHRLALIIADVSGKGIPAALFMALTVTVLRFAMEAGLSPLKMITNANQLMLSQQRSRLFVTVFVGYLNQQDGTLDYVSAGHNPPLLYRAADQTLEALHAKGVAAGVFATAQYEQKQTTLAHGDILVLYTDGITEIINDAEEEFSEERLGTVLATHADTSATEIAHAIITAIHTFAGGQASFDDETLMVIKRAKD